MDKRKTPGRKRRGSVDGIVRRGASLGVYQPTRGMQTPTLGAPDNRADGFYSSVVAPRSAGLATDTGSADTGAYLEEPILLDSIDDDKPKKRLKKKVKHAKAKKVIKRLALSLLVLIIATVAVLGYKFYTTQKHVLSGGGHSAAVCDGNVPLSELKHEGDGRVNILLAGIGSEGLLTDTLLIASVDPFNNKVDLLSIPRDLWVSIPGNGHDKINAVYEYGQKAISSSDQVEKNRAGMAALDKTLEKVVGVDIHYHAVFDFQAFKQIVNALGGVTVNVPETLYDPTIAWENHFNPVIARKGVQEFNGQQALLYAKSRETSSDFARAERQRLLLVAIKDKAFSVGTYSNPVKIAQLLNSLGKNVYSDFDSQSIKCLQKEVNKVPSNEIKSLDLVTPPHSLVTTGNLGGRSIVRPRAGLFDYSAIQDYVRSVFVDGLIARENAPIAVYNATNTPGLATTVSDKLKTYGYNITAVQNAPNLTNPSATTLVHIGSKKDKYTEHYLQGRFGVVSQSKLPSSFGITPPANTAFVIILGTNASLSN